MEIPYNASTLAAAAGVAFSWIARLCKMGKIDAVKMGNQWFIARDVGDAWLEARAERKAAEAEPAP
jgi:hypothetical protein